jgi:hypothetical protein
MVGLSNAEIEISARYAAYERLLEYLLVHHLGGRDPAEWGDIKSAIIGNGPSITKGIVDADDLPHIHAAIESRIDDIFERAASWAVLALG